MKANHNSNIKVGALLVKIAAIINFVIGGIAFLAGLIAFVGLLFYAINLSFLGFLVILAGMVVLILGFVLYRLQQLMRYKRSARNSAVWSIVLGIILMSSLSGILALIGGILVLVETNKKIKK